MFPFIVYFLIGYGFCQVFSLLHKEQPIDRKVGIILFLLWPLFLGMIGLTSIIDDIKNKFNI
jgi:hypothetical protein